MDNAVQTLRAHLQRAFSALAHQHAGEMLGRSSMARVLAGSAPRGTPQRRPEAPPASPARLRVGLALQAEPEPSVLQSALDAAVRLDAELDVFTSRSATHVRGEIARVLGLAAERCKVIALGPDLAAGIARYTRRHPDVRFVFMNLQAPVTEHRHNGCPARRSLFSKFLPVFDRAQDAAAKTYS